MVRALEAAEEQGVRLIVGAEIPILESGELALFVENALGYEHLCEILTELRREKSKDAAVAIAEVLSRPQGLFAAYAPPLEGGAQIAARLREAFGERLSLALVRRMDGFDRQRSLETTTLARQGKIALLATNRPRMGKSSEKPVLDVLECIREGITLEAAGRRLLPNGEARLKSSEEMLQLFSDEPQALSRSREIADACTFSMRELHYRFPEAAGRERAGETPNDALRRLTYEGAARRFGPVLEEKVVSQIEHELAIIFEIDVAPYVLSVHDVVEIAREKDILCQGRGSAANSAVCYCLGITAVDPSRSSLLFERFISVERREPPDIDVDFEHERREEVIQAIYDKVGRDRAAMVSEVISYRGKSALRDVGKAFGLSLEEVEKLSSLVSWFDPAALDPKRVREAGLDPTDGRLRQVSSIAQAIQGFPRHLSIHVGGFVLSSLPLTKVAPIEAATMQDRTVIPWDKDDIDTLRFYKIDILGLGMLSAIRRALSLVASYDPTFQGLSANDQLAKIPAEDPTVYEALTRADTVGVFQIESRAQMSMLPRLKPTKFYDLVIEVAIVRPGPIQGGMVHPYLRRRNGEEEAKAPHPILEPILERTLGVPLFQEQVMQIAIVGAGYTGGEADQLRRDMAAWKKHGRLERHRERLLSGFEARGISREFGERLYSQIKGFGEYGFPESHAASFALLVYASSWLKVHHPAAFAAALLDSQPMGFYSPNTIVQDAQRHGVEIRPVDVQMSGWSSSLEPVSLEIASLEIASEKAREKGDAWALRLGFASIKGLGEEAGRRVEGAAPYRDVVDLVDRARISKPELELFAESGALEPLIRGRRGALWDVKGPLGDGLFSGKAMEKGRPEFSPLSRPSALELDYRRTGISRDHPMAILRPKLAKTPSRAAILSSHDLMSTPHGRKVEVAGLVTCRQRLGTASGVDFVTLEDEFGFINLVLWARVYERLRYVANTSRLLLAAGKVEKELSVIHVVVSHLRPLDESLGVASMSRDFH